VKWGEHNGIVLGYGNGKFGAGDNVTNQQLAALIYRTQQATGQIPPDILYHEYPDLDRISDWAKDAVNILTAQGVFRDIPGSYFNPQDPATRCAVASMLYRYLTAI